jgi:putative oxidoreductase
MNWHFIIDILARICIVYTFLKSGIRNSRNPKPVLGMISSKHWPFPKVIYALTMLLLLIAPILIIVDFYAAFAAFGLLGFTVLSNLFFCNYWKIKGNNKHMTEFLFDANIAIIGGLILIISNAL